MFCNVFLRWDITCQMYYQKLHTMSIFLVAIINLSSVNMYDRSGYQESILPQYRDYTIGVQMNVYHNFFLIPKFLRQDKTNKFDDLWNTYCNKFNVIVI